MEKLLSSAEGGRIAERRGEIEALASEKEGKRVREMLGGDANIERMIKCGDTEALKKSVGDALRTPEGAQLLKKLRDIMK